MDRIAGMEAFTAVVETGGFQSAARQLGVSRALVSKRVAGLERAMGVQLLRRTTRKLSVTGPGEEFFERCRRILAEFREASGELALLQHEPRGALKVNAPMSFGALYLGTAIADVMAAYPDLKVEMTLNDRFIDPIEEGVDVTIRIATLDDSSLIARKLAPARRALVASPDYLARNGEPQSPDDLANHRCLNYGHTTTLQRWQLTHEGRTIVVPISSFLCSNNGDVLKAAALNGQGITKLPTFLVGPDIKAGRLVVVLPDYPPTELGLFALYAPNRYLAAKTRLLIDFLAARFGEHPTWDQT
jgi:DNA-binding transcriptional LysR family regulator